MHKTVLRQQKFKGDYHSDKLAIFSEVSGLLISAEAYLQPCQIPMIEMFCGNS